MRGSSVLLAVMLTKDVLSSIVACIESVVATLLTGGVQNIGIIYVCQRDSRIFVLLF